MSVDVHRHFHDELSHVKVRLLTMSGEAEAALGLAVEALLERDSEKAGRVIAGDRVIDAMEVEIEEQCVNLLALQQPMARDLRMLTSALKIANDLERVGDHAVNIAQSTERLLQTRPIAPEPEIVEMARLAREMLSDALEAFIRGDAAGGPGGLPEGRQGGRAHGSVFRILLTHMMEDPHTIGAGMELFLVSRNLERIADLATNIGEDVVFLVEGRSIKHHAEDRGEARESPAPMLRDRIGRIHHRGARTQDSGRIGNRRSLPQRTYFLNLASLIRKALQIKLQKCEGNCASTAIGEVYEVPKIPLSNSVAVLSSFILDFSSRIVPPNIRPRHQLQSHGSAIHIITEP